MVHGLYGTHAQSGQRVLVEPVAGSRLEKLVLLSADMEAGKGLRHTVVLIGDSVAARMGLDRTATTSPP